MIEYDFDTGYFVSKSEEREFSQGVKRAFSRIESNKAICHSISYYCMGRGIILPLNETIKNNMSKEDCIDKIQNLISCVFINPNAIDTGFAGANRMVGEIRNAINNDDIEQISQNANILLGYLNDALDNLSARDAEWNIRVSSSFDPVSWVHVEKDEEGEYYIASSECGLARNDYSNATTYPETGFYLTDITDGKRLTRLLNNTYGDGLFITTSSNENGESYVESSANQFELPSDADGSTEKIYFVEETTGEWRCFNE